MSNMHLPCKRCWWIGYCLILAGNAIAEEQTDHELPSEKNSVVSESIKTVSKAVKTLKPTLSSADLSEVDDRVDVEIKGVSGLLAENISAEASSILVADMEDFYALLPRLRALTTAAAQAVGYYDAKFKFIASRDRRTLTIEVTSGEPIRIVHYDLQVNSSLTSLIEKELAPLQLREGDIINHGYYDALKAKITTAASDFGFFDGYWQDAELFIDKQKHQARVVLHYETGARYRFGQTHFQYAKDSPQTELKPALLDKLIPYKAGDFYHNQLLSQLSQNLNNTRYFSAVRAETALPDPMLQAPSSTPIVNNNSAAVNSDDGYFFGFAPNEVKIFGDDLLNNTSNNFGESFRSRRIRESKLIPVTVTLNNSKPNRVEAGLGYATDTEFRLRTRYRRNLVNHLGHSAEANMEVSRLQQSLDMRYTVPYKDDALRDTLAGFVGLSEETSTVAQQNLQIQSISMGVERTILPGDQSWRHVISLRYNSDKLSNDEGSVNSRAGLPQRFQAEGIPLRQESLLPGYAISRVKTYPRLYPKYGLSQYYQVEAGTNALLTSTNLTVIRAGLATLVSMTDSLKHQLISRIDAGTILSTNFNLVPYKLRFLAGGDQSIRGYSNKSLGPVDSAGYLIGGQNLIVGSVEYNYAILPKWKLAIFADGGNSYDDKFSQKTKVGVGVGVRWQTIVGPLRLDFAAPLDTKEKQLGDLKIHFSLGSPFL